MLVLSVVFVSAVAALCSAQNNTIDISSTFTATGEVEWHVAEETLVGTCEFKLETRFTAFDMISLVNKL